MPFVSQITDKPRKFRQIFSTAEELFQKYGFRRVTIEEICQRASVSKMTFYKYFANKDELIKFMMETWFRESERIMREVMEMEVPFNEKILLLLKLKEEYSQKLSLEFFAEYVNPEGDLALFIKEFYHKSVAVFIDFVKKAQEKGEVRRDIKPEFLIAVLNQLLEMAKNQDLVKLYPSVTDFSLEVNNFFYCGILPLEKAQK
ncbi:MAG: TetR/AcrR family transcriptional regulator [Ignavibacteria bacterium]|jgi:AcrR family transcriptional regulator|nr:TetR/AcrR family transcriptional regulator [Ignavibacteria bacterium]MCU7522190.1 TetR/AcrR family transcriptional regulator [Ignavibacteria bacterium]MCU7525122.1 TetR/AcrR family transcriptional regulator [Ignavibacteria bacterium]